MYFKSIYFKLSYEFKKMCEQFFFKLNKFSSNDGDCKNICRLIIKVYFAYIYNVQ